MEETDEVLYESLQNETNLENLENTSAINSSILESESVEKNMTESMIEKSFNTNEFDNAEEENMTEDMLENEDQVNMNEFQNGESEPIQESITEDVLEDDDQININEFEIEESEQFQENETETMLEDDDPAETHEFENTEKQVTEKEARVKLTKLPIGRIRAIIKNDPAVNLINQEAVFLITTATEFFINSLAKESYKYTHQSKKKTVQKHDVQSAIDNAEALIFLDGI